jgi:hypothetical protein
MKRVLLLLFITAFATTGVLAQPKTKAKAKAKTTKTKAKVTPTVEAEEELSLSFIIKDDEGPGSFWDFKKGDQLVYHVVNGSTEYDFIVTLNSYDQKGIDFNYEATNANNTKGHVVVSADAKDKTHNYVNYFRGGELNLTNASTVWISYANFGDMPEKKTMMSFDGGPEETMYRPENEELAHTVKIKGEDKKIDVFTINNAADGKGDKTLWIHGLSANPLIVKMDLGWKIELKEIR